MTHIGSDGFSLWNEEDGFFYDVLRLPDGRSFPLKVRSMVGLIPLFAVQTLDASQVDRLPGFKRRMEWFIENRPDLTGKRRRHGRAGRRRAPAMSIVDAEPAAPHPRLYARRERVPVAVRHPLALQST